VLIKKDSKHNDIICAAISEFAEKGILATTMEAIAKRAQVSKRTLYKHYANKELLLDMVVELLLQRLKQFEQFVYDSTKPLLSQLREVAALSIQLNSDVDFLRLSRIVIIESMRSEHAAKRINEKFSVCEQGLHYWFLQAANAGALGKADPVFIASVFFGTIKKVSYWEQAIKWQAVLTEQQANQLVDQVCHLVAHYVRVSLIE